MLTQEFRQLDRSDYACIDISANLLSGYFDEKRSGKRQLLRRTSGTVGLVIGSLVLSGALFTMWQSAQSSLEGMRTELSRQEKILKATEAGFPSVQVPDNVLKMPIEFRQKNDLIVREIGHVLSSAGPSLSLMSLRYSEEGTPAIPKLVGQAESVDLAAVRQLLDRVQAALPGTQGMITSVAQPQAGQVGAFTVTFEIKPAPVAASNKSGGNK